MGALLGGSTAKYLVAPYEDDSKTYIKSFQPHQTKAIHAFFNKYGYVAVRNVLSPQECKDSISELFDEVEARSSDKFKRDDPSTWEEEIQDYFIESFGLVGGGQRPLLSPQANKNRQNPKILEAYRAATGRSKFLVAIERYGFMKPTAGRSDLQTVKNWLHIDMNPLTGLASYYGFEPSEAWMNVQPFNPKTHIPWQNAYFQGIVALSDCPEQTGGFHVVPGFHHTIKKWTAQHQEECMKGAESTDPTTVQIPEADPAREYVQRVPIRAGTLVIWRGDMAHGNFPNSSEKKARFVQYIKYNAIGDGIVSQVDPQLKMIPTLVQEVEGQAFSEEGKKLFGLKEWD